MGSCSSIDKSSVSAMKLGVLSFGSKTQKLEIPSSPVKEKLAGGDVRIKDVALKAWSPSPPTKTFGESKEESFFDSHPWLESDCEDDFYSVNGDFTPSRGNTPVSRGASKTPFEARLPVPATPSPTTKKKKMLLELFKESIRDAGTDSKRTMSPPEPKETENCAATETPYLSERSSERTANSVDNDQNEKTQMRMSRQCCLPSLVSCRSFSGRKKKLSPAPIA